MSRFTSKFTFTSRSVFASIAILSLAVGCAETVEPAPAPVGPAAKLAAFEAAGRSVARARYQQLGPDDKIELWRAHLARQAAEPGLSDEQRALLAELDANLPSLIARDMPADLERRVGAAFSFSEIDRRFGTLGNLDVSAPEVYFAASACEERWCTDCWKGATSGIPVVCGFDCSATSSGCGWFWQQSCNRLCEVSEEIPQ